MILSRKQLGRLREIGAVLVKHGWGHAIARAGLADMLHYHGTPRGPEETPVRVVRALEELGPTFVKLGQVLSTRPDLLTREYIAELTKLQDTAPTLPVEEIREVIREDLGRPAEEVYAAFDDRPLAAASLAQVHSAALHDGTQVIVKVQRPGIRDVIERDVSILYVLARFLEGRWERARTYGLTEVVDEFAITIREEMDYLREAHNTERLSENLSREDNACLPQVYWDVTTPRVLTLERIEGVKITDLDGLRRMQVDMRQLAARLASVFFRQILLDGFFHADPHPGNLLVTRDHKIALIDAGQVRQLDSAARTGLIRMLIAFEHQDTREFAQEIVALGIAGGEVDLPSLTRDLEKVLRQYYELPVRSIDVGRLLMRVMDVSARHRIRLPTGFAVIGKVLANIDGINRQLNPEFNFTEAARTFVSRAVRQQLRGDELLTDAYRMLMDAKSLLLSLPEHLNQLLHKAVEGSLRIEFRHRGLEDLESRLDKITNRLAFALIVGALIIGSSLIILSNQGPRGLFGLPFLGMIGYLVAAVFGIWLLISIIRSGRL